MDPDGARGQRSRRTRTALLRAGWQALARGKAATIGIADLTRNAGVATGSFYNHFSSKEELFAATVAEVVGQVARMLDDAASGVDDPARVIRAQMRAFGEIGVSRPDLAAAILAESYCILEHVEIRSRLFAPMRVGIAAGRFASHDPVVVLDLIGGVVVAILRTSQRTAGVSVPVVEWVDVLAQQIVTLLEQSSRPPGGAVSVESGGAICGA